MSILLPVSSQHISKGKPINNLHVNVGSRFPEPIGWRELHLNKNCLKDLDRGFIPFRRHQIDDNASTSSLSLLTV